MPLRVRKRPQDFHVDEAPVGSTIPRKGGIPTFADIHRSRGTVQNKVDPEVSSAIGGLITEREREVKKRQQREGTVDKKKQDETFEHKGSC